MGFFGDVLNVGGKIGLAGLTGGASLLPENTRAKIPIVNSLTGAESDEQKALVARQEAMAADMRKRKLANEQARLNAMGQRLAAFNPQNQMMARMFGPEAAFSPQQFAQMAADPYAMSQGQFDQETNAALMRGQINPNTRQREMSEADRVRLVEEQRRMVQEAERQKRIQAQMQPVGPGPAPIQQRAPQAARRY